MGTVARQLKAAKEFRSMATFLRGGQPFPSGDGIDGGDFEFTFQVLPGRAETTDDAVSLADFRILKDSFGSSRARLTSRLQRRRRCWARRLSRSQRQLW